MGCNSTKSTANGALDKETEAALTYLFHVMDRDHNGYLDLLEVQRFLAFSICEKTGRAVNVDKLNTLVKDFIKEADTNCDTRISLAEFLRYTKDYCQD